MGTGTKERIRKGLRKLHLEGVALKLLPFVRRVVWLIRKIGGVDKRISQRYVRANETLKLHIGCGGHVIDGWLNADLYPLSLDVLHLDASQPFSFCDEEFDYIFSEHMIEHLPYPQGVQMLSECYRVLKKNGRIRLSTPDLTFLMNLCKEEKSGVQKEYIKWTTDEIIRTAPSYDAVFVINNFVRDWGHQFIYDERVLSACLKRMGFTSVMRCALNASDDDTLSNLEHEQRLPEGFLRLETLTLEATKA